MPNANVLLILVIMFVDFFGPVVATLQTDGIDDDDDDDECVAERTGFSIC